MNDTGLLKEQLEQLEQAASKIEMGCKSMSDAANRSNIFLDSIARSLLVIAHNSLPITANKEVELSSIPCVQHGIIGCERH